VKLVVAIIQPTKLDAVREALERIEVTRMTVCDAQGFGRQRRRTEMYGGHEYPSEVRGQGRDLRVPASGAWSLPPGTALFRKIVLEIVVNDDFLERTVDTITGVARTGPEGNIGDGKIFVLPALEAIQIDDGAQGPGAV
jgi:nitrogen regulatory protein P-II 2